MKFPRSPYDTTGGMVYFPRMLDKIRLHASNELPEDYFENLGKAMDLRLCRYLHADYAALRDKVLAGMSDEDAFAWCAQTGQAPNEVAVMIWNGFMTKRGMRDEASELLETYKGNSGLAGRADIQTFFDYFEVDEKRRP